MTFEEFSGSDELINELRKDEEHRIVKVYLENPSPPELGPPVEEAISSEILVEALRRRGIVRLYRFQAEAVKSIKAGANTFVVAGTGTGKTEAFLIPILEDVLRDPAPQVRAILIYPTKALARDQVARINSFINLLFGVRALVLDGDIGDKERRTIYSFPPQILLTNPDMLHYGLMHSQEFRTLCSTAGYVVLDDAHAYSGVLGAHVSYVLKRLERIMDNKPIFIGTSATIGNPKEFAQSLFRDKVNVIHAGSGRRGAVIHAMLKPAARSRLAEVATLIATCVKKGLKTVAFADSHRAVELIFRSCQKLGVDVYVHRAGLLPEQRREVEKGLRSSEIVAVASTPTLELGIDIGDLDCVILANIPPSFSKYVQRTGRCGRRGRKAYVLTVLGDDPISQYYANFPDEFFSKEPEPIAIEAHNEEVAKIQLTAAAADLPLRVDEMEIFESRIVDELLKSGILKTVKGGKYVRCTPAGSRYLRERPGLRGTGEIVRIYDSRGKLIGFREMPAALKELFPGGVYLHGGENYLSVELSPTRAVVTKLPSHYSLVTSALYYSTPESFSPEIPREVLGLSIEYGKLSIREVVYGYVVRDFESGATLRETVLEKEYTYGFTTKGMLLRFPMNPAWDLIGNAEAFHAIEHVFITAAQAAVGASLTDLGGISFPTGHIFIYDAYPGGSGCAKLLFKRFEDAFSKALRILRLCDCEDGCPKCIYSLYCGNNNKVLSKKKALKMLDQVNSGKLAGLISIESVEGSPIV